MLDVLTPEQQAQLQKMMGDQFDLPDQGRRLPRPAAAAAAGWRSRRTRRRSAAASSSREQRNDVTLSATTAVQRCGSGTGYCRNWSYARPQFVQASRLWQPWCRRAQIGDVALAQPADAFASAATPCHDIPS